MKFFRFPAAAGLMTCVIAGTAPVYAQSPMDQFLTEKHVQKSVQGALENIQKAKCENEKPCAPATKEELKNPPVTIDQARTAVKAGIVSGTMQWCDLSWEARNFQPFLLHQRNAEGMNARQLAIMAWVHGIHQIAIREQLEKNPCPEATKQQMSDQMPLKELEQ